MMSLRWLRGDRVVHGSLERFGPFKAYEANVDEGDERSHITDLSATATHAEVALPTSIPAEQPSVFAGMEVWHGLKMFTNGAVAASAMDIGEGRIASGQGPHL
jgi:hypothetical protein